jgi:hypothetical protein
LRYEVVGITALAMAAVIGVAHIFTRICDRKFRVMASDNTELVIPASERKTVQTLTNNDCRWPIGDPQHSDFHFCGKRKAAGFPYCEFHVRRGWQPSRPRHPYQPAAASAISARALLAKSTA